MHFLVLRLYLLVGDRTFLIEYTFKNRKYTPKLTYSLNYLLTYLLTYLFTYLLSYLLTHLLTYLLTYLLTLPYISYLCSMMYSWVFDHCKLWLHESRCYISLIDVAQNLYLLLHIYHSIYKIMMLIESVFWKTMLVAVYAKLIVYITVLLQQFTNLDKFFFIFRVNESLEICIPIWFEK